VILIERESEPAVLAAEGSKAARERAAVATWFGDEGNRRKPYKNYKVYKDDEVVAALMRMFGDKCAYCESMYAQTAKMDVEHFRPKGGYVVGGELIVPGYWWLASIWENLLPSCIDCNRERTQKVPDRIPGVTGKANKFPLRDENGRATRKGEERTERPLLLNPCDDEPERYLVFREDGLTLARRKNLKAQTSIDTYGLNRDGLVRAREAAALTVKATIKRVIQAAENADRYPGDLALAAQLQAAHADLERHKDSLAPYAQLARQLIAEFEAGVR
jgi:uncharacterized protein (TIGR02646 family)